MPNKTPPTERQFQVLRALEEHGESLEKDVCSSAIARKLADAGLIVRTDTSPRMLKNTAAGSALAKESTERLKARLAWR